MTSTFEIKNFVYLIWCLSFLKPALRQILCRTSIFCCGNFTQTYVILTSLPVATATEVLTPTSVVNNARLKCTMKVLTGLGIAEVVVGSLAIGLSSVWFGYERGYPDHINNGGYAITSCSTPHIEYSHIGGIWCGVLSLICGALGIAIGRKRPTLCLINCHMVFSIVGALFAVLLSIPVLLVPVLGDSTSLPIILESIIRLITCILCIVSAVYCCLLKSSAGMQCCCRPCCTEQATRIGGGQNMDVTSPQSHQNVQQTVVQSDPPTMSGQQGSYSEHCVTAIEPGEAASNQSTLHAQEPLLDSQHQLHVG